MRNVFWTICLFAIPNYYVNLYVAPLYYPHELFVELYYIALLNSTLQRYIWNPIDCLTVQCWIATWPFGLVIWQWFHKETSNNLSSPHLSMFFPTPPPNFCLLEDSLMVHFVFWAVSCENKWGNYYEWGKNVLWRYNFHSYLV